MHDRHTSNGSNTGDGSKTSDGSNTSDLSYVSNGCLVSMAHVTAVIVVTVVSAVAEATAVTTVQGMKTIQVTPVRCMTVWCRFGSRLYMERSGVLPTVLSNQSQHVMVDRCRRKLVNVVFWTRYFSSNRPRSFFPFWRISWSVTPTTSLWPLFHYQALEWH